MKIEQVKKLFLIAALYDFVLGVIFLVAWKQIYSYFGVVAPNHAGYIQFGAALIAIFGIGFWFVSQNPERNRDIIKMGILLKTSYATVVLGHYFLGSMPGVWVPFAWFDLVFLGFFIGALKSLAKN